ncbi:hypothetical protein BUALT_Bualt03G0098400 [Buddleja alternifolia]|uniref:Uncharacterized protein n=1 Tax=Buddleja alternifolia TaxID=168488 RepID=A0AAV6XSP7_9LAMI|nr:hypothetical protein BUALT_Bualt03G0098400 [Buddleja alternifolia]
MEIIQIYLSLHINSSFVVPAMETNCNWGTGTIGAALKCLYKVEESQIATEEDSEMSLLWEKSQTWRWLVTKTRDSKPFFLTFATVCGVVPGIIGYCVMQLTNSSNPELEAKLRQSARPETRMMGKVNQERLAEYLGELKRKEDTNDRYVAALKGETLTRNPYVRIQQVPKPSGAEAKTEAKKEQK